MSSFSNMKSLPFPQSPFGERINKHISLKTDFLKDASPSGIFRFRASDCLHRFTNSNMSFWSQAMWNTLAPKLARIMPQMEDGNFPANSNTSTMLQAMSALHTENWEYLGCAWNFVFKCKLATFWGHTRKKPHPSKSQWITFKIYWLSSIFHCFCSPLNY